MKIFQGYIKEKVSIKCAYFIIVFNKNFTWSVQYTSGISSLFASPRYCLRVKKSGERHNNVSEKTETVAGNDFAKHAG